MTGSPRILVVGVGNPDRGDDAAGRMVARKLAGSAPAGVEIAEHDGEAASLVELMEGADGVILVDACTAGTPPGTVHRFDAAERPLPQKTLDFSTHGFGLAEAIELARALDQLPARCFVYAIEIQNVTEGAALSPAVAAAVDRLAQKLRRKSAEMAEHA